MSSCAATTAGALFLSDQTIDWHSCLSRKDGNAKASRLRQSVASESTGVTLWHLNSIPLVHFNTILLG